MGIDRIVALLTGQPNLRDVILFPLVKEKNENKSIIAAPGEAKGKQFAKQKSGSS